MERFYAKRDERVEQDREMRDRVIDTTECLRLLAHGMSEMGMSAAAVRELNRAYALVWDLSAQSTRRAMDLDHLEELLAAKESV